ncbi:hypothetical protein DRQ33_05265 [bacterium]|nr:MAG: hypothetical protein DRQ33_05265 [bacterium]
MIYLILYQAIGILAIYMIFRIGTNLWFHLKVKRNCNINTKSGIKVQSNGEKRIANWLYDRNIQFIYDKPLYGVLLGGYRPDFRIKRSRGKDIIIEYWGRMDLKKYRIKRRKKKKFYMKKGFILISIEPHQKVEKILWDSFKMFYYRNNNS